MFNPADALASPAFNECLETARACLSDPSKAGRLLANASAKLDEMEASRGPVGDAVRAGRTGVRMVQAYVDGRYKAVPVRSLVSIAAAMLYFIRENDLIDDNTPFVGYLDDAAVIMLALKMVKGDLDDFIAWEAGQQATTF
jgi:uncharacterized membrane protein YkvA (DUF1232 family)